jgi:hypothetical protein
MYVPYFWRNLIQPSNLHYKPSNQHVIQQALQLRKPQSRSQSMPVRGLCSVHNPRTGILWERDCASLRLKFQISTCEWAYSLQAVWTAEEVGCCLFLDSETCSVFYSKRRCGAWVLLQIQIPSSRLMPSLELKMQNPVRVLHLNVRPIPGLTFSAQPSEPGL